MPSREEYIKLHTKYEFFDITISLFLGNKHAGVIWEIPYPINIHKVTKYITDNNILRETFRVSDLAQLINPECFEEFNEYMEGQRFWSPIIGDIKANNPVIILRAGGLLRNTYLINGTHRTIQAIKESKETIDGFVVSCDICRSCGMSTEYENLYTQMMDICNSAHGFKKGCEIENDS